jgi:hypothetical protein
VSEPFAEKIFPTTSFSEKVNLAESSISAFEASQVAIFESGLPQLSLIPNRVRTTEISLLPTTVVTPDGVTKIGISHNDSTQVNTDGRTFQVNTAKVDSSHQIVVPIIENDLSKVSLTSGISSQQFFNSNLLSFNLHDLNPNVKNIYLTTKHDGQACPILTFDPEKL